MKGNEWRKSFICWFLDEWVEVGNKGTVRISVSHVEYVDQTCLSCEDEEGPMPLGPIPI